MQKKNSGIRNFFKRFSITQDTVKLSRRELIRLVSTYTFPESHIPTAKELDIIEATIETLEMIEAIGIHVPDTREPAVSKSGKTA